MNLFTSSFQVKLESQQAYTLNETIRYSEEINNSIWTMEKNTKYNILFFFSFLTEVEIVSLKNKTVDPANKKTVKINP